MCCDLSQRVAVGTRAGLCDQYARSPTSCCTDRVQAAWSWRWLRLTFSSSPSLICCLRSHLWILLLLCFPAFPNLCIFYLCLKLCYFSSFLSPPRSWLSSPPSPHFPPFPPTPLAFVHILTSFLSPSIFLRTYLYIVVHLCVFYWVSSTPSSVLSNTNFPFLTLPFYHQ